jgi:L-lactate dehydrogenase complex protein LldE
MMEDKVGNIQASGAEYIVAGDPGCLMNIAGGLHKIKSPIQAKHLISILAAQE